MKTTYKCLSFLASIVSLLLLFSACSNDSFNAPDRPEPGLSHIRVTHTISELKAMYRAGGHTILHNVVIAGTVSTDDAEGNFYKTMDIQDETGGIELKMGLSNLGLRYKRGNTVYVHCAGLSLGKYGGVVNLGYPAVDSKYETGYVPDRMVPKVLTPGNKGKLEIPELTIPQLTPNYANTLVKLSDVQFKLSELGYTWADPVHKNESGKAQINRTIEDRAGNTVIVRTSSYARFAGNQLPEGSGSMTALLTFFNGTPQLMVVSLSDIHLLGARFIPKGA